MLGPRGRRRPADAGPPRGHPPRLHSAIHRAREVGDWAYAEAGATAIFESQPFERRFRDLHAASQQVQGRAAHLETAGRHLLGLDPGLRFL